MFFSKKIVPLHHMPHLLEARDEVEYSIHISSGFQVKKFGVNLIYENDKKDCHSYFRAVVKNASLPCKDDFLDKDVSTDQPMASDKKINPFYLQVNFNNPQDLGCVWRWLKKLTYFCYYSWIPLQFLVLFMGPTVLFQLTFTFL